MKIMMYKNGMVRPAQPEDVERFREAGWQLEASTVVDSGAMVVRAPKKKKVETPAETVPEAAKEDLDNAINQGE